jgi:anaerobic magnesium-protoporphyrin IX monomethyl ester cyclase
LAKVFLINPCSPESNITRKERYITLGILYLSSFLKKSGHEVRFLDLNNEQINCMVEGVDFNQSEYYDREIRKVITDFKPDLIGFSVHYSGRFHPAIEVCKMIKNDYPQIQIVIGGIHPTIFPKKILDEYDCVDFILQGESEESLVALVDNVDKKVNDYEKVDGLAYRIDGRAIVNKKINFIDNLDKIPFPDYDLVDVEKYYFDTSNWINPKGLAINLSLYILTSRSCPRQCTYCSMFIAHGPKYRMRSADNIISEIEYLYHRYNQRYFSFMDDNFTLNKKRTIEICSGILAKGLDIQFDTPNGLELNTLDEEIIDVLVETGLVKTCLAIESGSPEIRKSINKRLTQEKIFSIFNTVKKYSELSYNVFFIIGFPNETHQTLEETYQLIKQLELKNAVISFATPFPGTQLYNECVANNLIEIDHENMHNYGQFYYANEEPFIKPHNLEKEDLVNFRLKVYTELHIKRSLEPLSF